MKPTWQSVCGRGEGIDSCAAASAPGPGPAPGVFRLVPRSGASRPPTRWSRVDLPAPEAPVMPTASPAEAEKETPRRTSTRLPVRERNAFHRLLTRSSPLTDRCCSSKVVIAVERMNGESISSPGAQYLVPYFGLYTKFIDQAMQIGAADSQSFRGCNFVVAFGLQGLQY